MKQTLNDDALIETVFNNPAHLTLYGTGSFKHYQSNKLLFPNTLKFLSENDFIEEKVASDEQTVVVLFAPIEMGIQSSLLKTKYRFIELFKFIDYKAKIFWGNKGEYKGIDRNHYMSNEVVVKELKKNRNIIDLIPTDKDISVLSLGCGTGNLERQLLEFPNIKLIDAIDISKDSIDLAIEKIHDHERKSIVHYQEGNLNDQNLPANKYDLIVAQECIHHIQNLERLYQQISVSMKPEGLLIQSEYVGPNRFQFEDYIIFTVNCILRVLPKRFRERELYKKTTLFDIIQADPSEAVRSSEIVPLTQRFFKDTVVYNHSGTLMHILHQKLNMDYFYTTNSKPKRNLVLSILLTKIVFFIEMCLLSDRYSHMSLLKSVKKQSPEIQEI